MIWTFSTPTVQNVVEPQTVPITITGKNEMLILLLATSDGRDNSYTATFNGNPMSQWGYQIRYDYADNQYCSIQGLGYNTSNMTPGTYNMYKDCTTGGPDEGVEAWFLVRGLYPVNPIDNTHSASGRSSTISTTVTASQNNEMIITVYNSRKDGVNAVTPVTSGLTQLFYSNSYNNQFATYYKQVDVGTHPMTFTQGSDRWAACSMSLKIGHDMGSFLMNFV